MRAASALSGIVPADAFVRSKWAFTMLANLGGRGSIVDPYFVK